MLAAAAIAPLGGLAIFSLVTWLQRPGLARRDQQDRSIEFWLSLPVGHATRVAVPLAMHLLVVPLVALAVGWAFGQAFGRVVVARSTGAAAWLGLPWGPLVRDELLALLSFARGAVVATFWMLPLPLLLLLLLLLLAMAASAWLKRGASRCSAPGSRSATRCRCSSTGSAPSATPSAARPRAMRALVDDVDGRLPAQRRGGRGLARAFAAPARRGCPGRDRTTAAAVGAVRAGRERGVLRPAGALPPPALRAAGLPKAFRSVVKIPPPPPICISSRRTEHGAPEAFLGCGLQMNFRSIAFRLNALFVASVTTALAIFGTVSYTRSMAEQKAAVDRQVQAASVRLSSNLPGPLWAFDKAQIEQVLNAEMAEASIAGIQIRNGDKKLAGVARDAGGVVRAGTEVSTRHDSETTAKLTFVEGSTRNAVGEVTIFVTLDEVKAALRKDLAWMAAAIVAVDLVLLLILSAGLKIIVLRPLAQVRTAMRDISAGDADLTKRLPDSSVVEFNEISGAFNTFLGRLQGVIAEVRQGSDSLAVASQEIASGNGDLSVRTEQQASALQHTASAVEDLTAAMRHNADNARLAASMSVSARDVAVQGGEVVSQVVSTMGSINASSKKIVDIISVIEGIAFQTNILALNAAVEAARAGDQGRGFAVVASEVRSLAQRSAAAAKEISALIGDSVQRVDTGGKLVAQAGSTIQEVVSSVKRVTELMADILNATQNQARGVEEVNEALRQMDSGTQKNSALVEEATAATEAMKEQTAHLNRVVGVFRIGA